MSKRAFFRKWICLILAAVMLTGCTGTPERKERENGGEIATATPTVTPTPSPVPATPTPSPSPTPTPKGSLYGTPEEEQKAFSAFLDEVFVDMIGTTELLVHFTLEHPEKFGIQTDYELLEEPMDYKQTAEDLQVYAEKLYTFTYDNLTAAQKVDYDRLDYEIRFSESVKDTKVCMNTLMRVNNNSVNNLSTYLTEYYFGETKDYDSYVEILKSLPAYLDSLFGEMERYCKEGYGPTQEMYDKTIENIENIGSYEDNVILAAFRENAKELNLEEEAYRQCVETIDNTLQTVVCPAFEKLLSDVKTLEQYIVAPRSLASLEGGKDYYRVLAQATTGSNWTVDQMYNYLLGKAQDMLSECTSTYMKDQSVFERMEENDYASSDFNVILDDLKERTRKEFPAIRDTQYIVSALPDELCVDGVLAYFLSPQYDNPDHKIIRVNPHNTSTNTELFSTLAHEGYPGHLYQDEYFRMTEGYHPINSLLSYTGYMEGWATMMGTDAYLWATDGDAGVSLMYDFDYTYSMSLIGCCDIGVNYYNWSEDKLKEFLTENRLNAAASGEIYSMIVADPVIYLPYSLCHFQCIDIIEELMSTKHISKTEAYKEFLEVGPCSFDVLRKNLGISPE